MKKDSRVGDPIQEYIKEAFDGIKLKETIGFRIGIKEKSKLLFKLI